MRVLLFVSSDPARTDLVDPMLAIPDRPDAALPPHPQGLEWRYFATTTLDDQLLVPVRAQAEAALADYGWFVFGEPPDQRSAISNTAHDEATLAAFAANARRNALEKGDDEERPSPAAAGATEDRKGG